MVCFSQIPGAHTRAKLSHRASSGHFPLSFHIWTSCQEVLGERRKEKMENMASLVVQRQSREGGCELGFTVWGIPRELQPGTGGLK